MYQVLKARYFKNYSILEALKGSAPSFFCRSLCHDSVVLEHNSHWQIGNGLYVKICGDKWIPNPNTFQILSMPMHGYEEFTVGNLIDPVTVQWRESILTSWFSVEKAKRILRIPLSHPGPSID